MTIDYHSPPDAPPRRPIFSTAAFAAVAIPVVLIYLVVFILIPRVESVYADFGVRLPAVTQIMLDAARMAQSWGYAPGIALPVVAALLVPRLNFGSSPETRRTRSRWVIAMLIANLMVLFLLILVVIAVVLPWYHMMDNIAGQR